jgi:glycerate dehydrogenase
LSPAETTTIVVADGFTTARDDLDWAALGKLGAVTVYECCGDELVTRCLGADIVLTNKELFDARVLSQLPRLRYISVLATGTNVIDLAAAGRNGVLVSNVPSYSTDSVAQHVFALMLELNNQTGQNAAASRDRAWTRSRTFSAPIAPVRELRGKRLGVVGLGNIGRRVADIGIALGMDVLAAARHSKTSPADSADPPGVTRVPLADLFRLSDVVTLHCPLTEQTRGLVDRARLATMKPTALLLNTGRGPLVDEQALADALHAGALAGAGLDVLTQEPPPDDNPLLDAPNCLVTPHMAWASVEARRRLLEVSVANVAAFLNGVPQNLVV